MTPTFTLSSSIAMIAHALVLIAAVAGVVFIGVFARRLGGAVASLGIIGCLCLIPESIVQAIIQFGLYTFRYESFTTILVINSAAILLRNAGTVLLIIALLLGARRRLTVPVAAHPIHWPAPVPVAQQTTHLIGWGATPTEQQDPSTGSPPAGPAR